MARAGPPCKLVWCEPVEARVGPLVVVIDFTGKWLAYRSARSPEQPKQRTVGWVRRARHARRNPTASRTGRRGIERAHDRRAITLHLTAARQSPQRATFARARPSRDCAPSPAPCNRRLHRTSRAPHQNAQKQKAPRRTLHYGRGACGAIFAFDGLPRTKTGLLKRGSGSTFRLPPSCAVSKL